MRFWTSNGLIQQQQSAGVWLSVISDEWHNYKRPIPRRRSALSFTGMAADRVEGAPVCRICYEADGKLIHPCRCTGSMHLVHNECINQWVHRSGSFVCNVCNVEMAQTTRLRCPPCDQTNTNVTFFFLLWLLLYVPFIYWIISLMYIKAKLAQGKPVSIQLRKVTQSVPLMVTSVLFIILAIVFAFPVLSRCRRCLNSARRTTVKNCPDPELVWCCNSEKASPIRLNNLQIDTRALN